MRKQYKKNNKYKQHKIYVIELPHKDHNFFIIIEHSLFFYLLNKSNINLNIYK
jgi:hypothetical protein